jgi:hypothetical protein
MDWRFLASRVDRYANLIFECLSQSDKFVNEVIIRQMIQEGLEEAIKLGRMNREIGLCLPASDE